MNEISPTTLAISPSSDHRHVGLSERAAPLGGRDLRYLLALLLHERGPLRVSDLVDGVTRAGFVVEGRPSKVVSDALRWEIARGRVVPSAGAPTPSARSRDRPGHASAADSLRSKRSRMCDPDESVHARSLPPTGSSCSLPLAAAAGTAGVAPGIGVQGTWWCSWGGSVEWSAEVERAQWWVDRLEPGRFDVDDLRPIVPGGFEALRRIFHPVDDEAGEPSTWTTTALAHDRIPHAEMQLNAISTPVGTTPVHRINELPRARWGELPEAEMRALAAALESWTATPDSCWFGVWEGYDHPAGRAMPTRRDGPRGWLARRRHEYVDGRVPRRVLEVPRIHTSDRDYCLLKGALAEIDRAAELIGDESPNLWWPEDRAWFVISEIDFAWTYVAGTSAMVDAIGQVVELETFEADYSHSAAVTGDRLNV